MKKQMLLTAFTIFSILLLTACSPAAQMEAPAAAASPAAPAATPPPPAAPAPAAPAPPPPADAVQSPPPVAVESDYFRFPTLTPSRAGDRRLIYTVNMRLQTSEFLPGMRRLLNTVDELDGYLVSVNMRGYDLHSPTADRWAGFRFRVPTENLSELIFVIENNYNIWSLNKEMLEVTEWYQQIDWDLEYWRERESYLLELVERARGDARDAALDELRNVRGIIRSSEGTQANIMSDVIYSTVDIQLFEAIPLCESEEVMDDNRFELIVTLLIAGTVIIVIVIFVIQRQQKNKSKNSDIR